MLTNLLMFIVMFACVAMLYTDGLWSNAIRLVNVVTAALLAMTFFEPLADWLEQWQPSYEYFWDFISLWGLFIIFSIIFRQITDRISQVQVKFLKIADRIGSGILSVWIGWIMVCFHHGESARRTSGKTPLLKVFNLKREWWLDWRRIVNGWDSRKNVADYLCAIGERSRSSRTKIHF